MVKVEVPGRVASVEVPRLMCAPKIWRAVATASGPATVMAATVAWESQQAAAKASAAPCTVNPPAAAASRTLPVLASVSRSASRPPACSVASASGAGAPESGPPAPAAPSRPCALSCRVEKGVGGGGIDGGRPRFGGGGEGGGEIGQVAMGGGETRGSKTETAAFRACARRGAAGRGRGVGVRKEGGEGRRPGSDGRERASCCSPGKKGRGGRRC
jgi:hypothetical protein